jgi:hypothetical protein
VMRTVTLRPKRLTQPQINPEDDPQIITLFFYAYPPARKGRASAHKNPLEQHRDSAASKASKSACRHSNNS